MSRRENLSDNAASPDRSTGYEKALKFFQQQQYHLAEKALVQLLQNAPDNIQLLALMSQVSEARGRYKEQFRYLQAMTKMVPDPSEYLIQMAFAKLNLGELADAGKLAGSALQNTPSSVAIYRSAAKIFHALGQYQLSINSLEKALEVENGDFQIFYDLGASLALCGKIDEATNAYQRAIQLNPNFGMAYAALTKVRKASEQQNNIDVLPELIKQNRNPWVAINIHHGLAKEYDDMGRYQDAFNTLRQGKKRLLSVCPHSPASGAHNINALANLYAKHVNEITSVQVNNNAAPIFVTGMPRTGTTIVERILTNHHKVCSVGERIQLSSLLKKQCNKGFPGLVDAQVLADSWPTINFTQLGQDYIESVKYLSGGAHRFVDKLPLNILLAGVILRSLPNAKIICLMRNPLDTIIGNYRQVFEYSTGTYAYTLDLNAAAHFVVEFQQLARQLQTLFPDRFKIVEYEKLVAKPVEQAKTIIDFCQLSWNKSVVDIHKNNAAVGTASAAQVKEPIHQRAVGHAAHYQFCLQEVEHFFREMRKGGVEHDRMQ